jgi:hypothetical protein
VNLLLEVSPGYCYILILFIKCLEVNWIGFVVNSLTKSDCPVLAVLISLQVLLYFRIAYSPPLGDIKGLSYDPFSRWWFYIVYVSDRIVAPIWDRARQLWESGEYRMGGMRVICFYIRNFKGSSPCLCRLTAMSVETCGTSINYVLAHTRFMESCKLSSFNGRWIGWHPTILNRWHGDSVWATHWCPSRYHVKDMH